MKSPIKVLPYFVLKWPCQLTGRLNPRTHRLLPHSRKTTWNWIANSFLEKENLIQFLFSVHDKTGFCNCTSCRSQLYLGDHQYYAPHPPPPYPPPSPPSHSLPPPETRFAYRGPLLFWILVRLWRTHGRTARWKWNNSDRSRVCACVLVSDSCWRRPEVEAECKYGYIAYLGGTCRDAAATEKATVKDPTIFSSVQSVIEFSPWPRGFSSDYGKQVCVGRRSNQIFAYQNTQKVIKKKKRRCLFNRTK